MIEIVLEDDPALKIVVPLYDFDEPLNIVTTQDEFGLTEFIDAMFVTMKLNKGLGLAANQIGQNVRVFVMDFYGEEFICINPIIEQSSTEFTIDQEGCLSFPDLSLNVKRSSEIFVSYSNIDGVEIQRWLSGITARCFQHELDHLNGITFDSQVAKLSLKMAKDKRRKKIKQKQRNT